MGRSLGEWAQLEWVLVVLGWGMLQLCEISGSRSRIMSTG